MPSVTSLERKTRLLSADDPPPPIEGFDPATCRAMLWEHFAPVKTVIPVRLGHFWKGIACRSEVGYSAGFASSFQTRRLPLEAQARGS